MGILVIGATPERRENAATACWSYSCLSEGDTGILCRHHLPATLGAAAAAARPLRQYLLRQVGSPNFLLKPSLLAPSPQGPRPPWQAFDHALAL